MRLGDLDALKDAVVNNFDNLQAYFPRQFIEEIDNAPTVPLPDFKDGYKQAIIDGKTNFARQQGEREFIEILANYTPDDLCTYPEYRGKPYYSIHYRENGEEFVGYGTYNIEVLSRYLQDYFFNAPTIDLKNIYQEGHYDGHIEGYTKAINEERPQGEPTYVSDIPDDKVKDLQVLAIDYGEGIAVFERKRLKGEWKKTGYETGALGITYRQTQCSNCGWEHSLAILWNYCPNCGADMRGDSAYGR